MGYGDSWSKCIVLMEASACVRCMACVVVIRGGSICRLGGIIAFVTSSCCEGCGASSVCPFGRGGGDARAGCPFDAAVAAGAGGEPDTDRLLLFRHNFLMLFTGFNVVDGRLRLLLFFPNGSSDESIENRLEGACDLCLGLVVLLVLVSLFRDAWRSGGISKVEYVIREPRVDSEDDRSSDIRAASESNGKRPNGSGDRGMTGELETSALRREGGTISGYDGSWPSNSRFLAMDSSDASPVGCDCRCFA